jgi:hypothetical protein
MIYWLFNDAFFMEEKKPEKNACKLVIYCRHLQEQAMLQAKKKCPRLFATVNRGRCIVIELKFI